MTEPLYRITLEYHVAVVAVTNAAFDTEEFVIRCDVATTPILSKVDTVCIMGIS